MHGNLYFTKHGYSRILHISRYVYIIHICYNNGKYLVIFLQSYKTKPKIRKANLMKTKKNTKLSFQIGQTHLLRTISFVPLTTPFIPSYYKVMYSPKHPFFHAIITPAQPRTSATSMQHKQTSLREQ